MASVKRSPLRLSDLEQATPKGATRVMNVKLPMHLITAIDQLAKRLGTSKTRVVIALLNEGVALARKKQQA